MLRDLSNKSNNGLTNDLSHVFISLLYQSRYIIMTSCTLFTSSGLIIFSTSSRLKSSESSLDCVRKCCWKNTIIFPGSTLLGREIVKYVDLCLYIYYKFIISQYWWDQSDFFVIKERLKNRPVGFSLNG